MVQRKLSKRHIRVLLIEKLLNLRWIHKSTEIPFKVQEEKLIPPPDEQLALLYQFAMLGNMHQLQRLAAEIEQLDEDYIPFAKRLNQLAKQFEDEKILSLIEQSMS